MRDSFITDKSFEGIFRIVLDAHDQLKIKKFSCIHAIFMTAELCKAIMNRLYKILQNKSYKIFDTNLQNQVK